MTLPNPFSLERYFARYEFDAPYLISSSDCETLSVAELMAMAERSIDELGSYRLGYTESPGAPSLRTAISQLYDGHITADDVLIVVPEEGIFLTMWALLSPGDEVIVQTPCYQSLSELAAYHGAEVMPWPLVETEDSWQVDLDRLADLISPKTKLIVINTPHNPTGFHFSRSELDAIFTMARHQGIWVFSDEMYWGSEYRVTDRLPPASQIYERGVSLSGMSKTFGLPGLRIGWLMSQNTELVANLQQLKDYTTICSSGPSEFLAEVALTVAPKLMARSLNIIQSNLPLAREFANHWSNFVAWRAPMAGSVAFVRYRSGNIADLARQLVEAQGVMLAPSHTFQFGDSHFRFGLGRLNFVDGLGRFSQYLEAAML